jgi:AAA15 family ATPase/GTPase
MGDGMWRILAMVIAITQCKDGVLLVDEIDTGLHHTVMYDMWKVLYSASQLLNVQVFATTHSYDCVASLAKVCMENAGEEEQIALHRIENGNPASVAYTQQQLIAAADMGFEVR